MKYRPYTIWTPDWNTTSGGIRVMYGLYGALLLKGQEIHQNVRYSPGIKSIAIYPEIANGNPLGGDTVVRYLLNKPGVMSNGREPSPTTFDFTDRIYVFSELFNTVKARPDHIMFLPILNTHLFYDQERNRTKKAVFVGKGVDTGKHPQGCILIDRTLAQDQQALADLLNECEVLYDYDPVSAMTELARLCGCRVVMFNDQYTKEEYAAYEPGMNGIGWGVDASLDVPAFREHYMGLKARFLEQIDVFIDQTQR